MTASQEEIIEICEDMSRYFDVSEIGPGVAASVNQLYEEDVSAMGFQGLRDRGWYLSMKIPNEGGDFHILMPWGNPWSENDD